MSIYQYIFFVLFVFFITLVLMNMLIAIMSDTYATVKSNILAANMRILAKMVLEADEVLMNSSTLPVER